MNNWKYDKLSKLCDEIGDGLHGTPEYTDYSDIFFINGNNLKNGKIEITKDTKRVTSEELSKNFIELNKNTLLLSINGTLGSVAFYNNEKVMLGKSCAYINFKNDINRFYYYYFQLNEIKKFFYNEATGSTIKNLSLKSLQDFNVPIPELNEWQKIAGVLSALDAKIELNNRINAELEAMAKTIYDYWFVQFDFLDENGKPYKSSGGKMVYNKQLKREIPEGWEVKNLKDWIANEKAGDWGKDSIEEGYTEKVICIRGTDINGLNGLDSFSPPERFILGKNKGKILEPNEFIIEISGGSPTQSTGRIGLITKETLSRFNGNVICSNFCRAFSIVNPKLVFNFLYLWNRLYLNGVLFGHESKTTGIKNLLFDSFVKSYYEIFPPKHLYEKFYDILIPIHSKKQINIAENQHLTQLRDWLLPMLMNGQVKVK